MNIVAPTSHLIVAIFTGFLSLVSCTEVDQSNTGLDGLLNQTYFLQMDPTITSLNLSWNSITGFNDSSVLSQFTSLTVLDLSHNRLGSVPAGLFDQLQNLQTVYFSHNHLDDLPSTLLVRTAIQILDLSFNQINIVKSSVFNSTTLQNLDLSRNPSIAINNQSFQALPALTNLKLNNNTLSNFADGCFNNLVNLTVIEFSYNKFTKFPSQALLNSRVPALTSIIAAGNLWTSFTDADLYDGFSLQTLDISGDTVTMFSADAFSNLHALRSLNFRQTQLIWMPPYLLANLTSYNTTLNFDNWPKLTCAPYMPSHCSVCSASSLPICPAIMPTLPPGSQSSSIVPRTISSAPSSLSVSSSAPISTAHISLLYDLDLNFTLTQIWNDSSFTTDLKTQLSTGLNIGIGTITILNVIYDYSTSRTTVAVRIHSDSSSTRKSLISKINNDMLDPSSTIRGEPIFQSLDAQSIHFIQYCTSDGTLTVDRNADCPNDIQQQSTSTSNYTVVYIVGIVVGIVAVIFIVVVIREIFVRCRGSEIPKPKNGRPQSARRV